MSRLLFFGLIVAVFIWLVRTIFPSSNGDDTATKEMVKDPNCDIYVPQSEAIPRTVQGTDYFFCSEKCADEYSHKNG
jgi:YHS domain-containing protein